MASFHVVVAPGGGSRRLERKASFRRTVTLLALCDLLEAQLAAVRTESGRLLEAVLHEALAPAA
jgi:hypothetical protein